MKKFVFTCGKLDPQSIYFAKNTENTALIVENSVDFVDSL